MPHCGTHEYGRRSSRMIELDRVCVAYDNCRPLRDISYTFGSGAVAVMGPSGSGKSTMLRVMAGLQEPTSGRVEISGLPVSRPSWHSAGDPRVTLIHQDYRLVQFLTVGDNLRITRETRGLEASPRELVGALRRVGLAGIDLSRMPATLSGGEQQRVAIARSLLAGSEVLLADEPTGALDAANSVAIAQLLHNVGRKDGLAVVVATHDLDVASIIGRRLSLRGSHLRTV